MINKEEIEPASLADITQMIGDDRSSNTIFSANLGFNINQFLELIELQPNSDLPYLLFTLKFANRHSNEALEKINKAISLNPSSCISYALRAYIHVLQKSFDAAILDITEAIALDPKDSYPLIILSECFVAQNKLQAALSAAHKAVEIDNNFFKPYEMRGSIYKRMNQFELAIEDYKKALNLNLESVGFQRICEIYNKLGDRLAAIHFITDCIANEKLQRIPYHIYLTRGQLYEEIDDFASAAADYKHANQLDPSNENIYFMWASCLQKHRKYEEARVCYHDHLKLCPRDSIYWHIANTYALEYEENKSDSSKLELYLSSMAVYLRKEPEQDAFLEIADRLLSFDPKHINHCIHYLSEGIKEYPESCDLFLARSYYYLQNKQLIQFASDYLMASECIDKEDFPAVFLESIYHKNGIPQNKVDEMAMMINKIPKQKSDFSSFISSVDDKKFINDIRAFNKETEAANTYLKGNESIEFFPHYATPPSLKLLCKFTVIKTMLPKDFRTQLSAEINEYLDSNEWLEEDVTQKVETKNSQTDESVNKIRKK